MVRERIADDIYVFTSRRYAHVTAGAILTRDGVVLIDTLFYPEETRAIKEFLEERLGLQVRYVVNTHYHADHTQGTFLFPDAEVISHALCRELLDTIGREGLQRSQLQTTDFDDVQIALPGLVFREGSLNLTVGEKHLRIFHMPGHSPDLINVWVREDDILFAADNMMPVPTFFDGSYNDLVHSLERIREMHPDSVVQGHGEVILRGEVESIIDSNLHYLTCIKEKVSALVGQANASETLSKISIESCGKSRIPLNGLVAQLHQANLQRLYEELTEAASPDPA